MSRALRFLAFAAGTATIAGCASRHAPPPAAAPQPVVAAPERPAPPELPPGVTEVPPLKSPNGDLSPAESVWHLRAGLNVAALQCGQGDTAIARAYGQMLATHRAELAAAHDRLLAERGRSGFDSAMTAVYNYFAQPPVRDGLCAIAAPVLAEAGAVPRGGFSDFALRALPRIEQPFAEMRASYARYRRDMAAWERGEAVAGPRLAYDPSVLMGGDQVTGGPIRVARR